MFLNWFIDFGTHHEYLVYLVIILTSSFEGPILALVAGLLLRMGFLSIIPIYICLMIGDLLGDTFWYWIGRTFGHKFIKNFGGYFHITENSVRSVERIFHKYSDTILIVSKLTMGLGFALVTLITAGMAKIPYRRYMLLNLLGQFVWTAVLLLVGFTLGDLYITFDNIFARISIVSASVIVIVGLFQYGKYVKKVMIKRI